MITGTTCVTVDEVLDAYEPGCDLDVLAEELDCYVDDIVRILRNNYEFEMSDLEYEDILFECEGYVSIAGIEFCAGRALKLLDPIAFRCFKSDYCSNRQADLEDQWTDALTDCINVRPKA